MSKAPTRAAPAVEVIPGRLYALSNLVDLDGRVSWGPKNGGLQPVSCYLLPGTTPPTLVDTGLAAHRAAFGEQLRSLLPPGSKLVMYLTRAEMDCSGNVGLVMGEYDLVRMDNYFTGGGFNPMDGFEDSGDPSEKRRNRTVLGRVLDGQITGELEQINPPFLVQINHWAYHAGTKTLFSSDIFGHTALAGPDDPVIIDSTTRDDTSVESVIPHLLARFFWLDGGRTGIVRQNLADVFERFDVEIIAPSHGRILRGKDVVRRHVDLLDRALARLDRDYSPEVNA